MDYNRTMNKPRSDREAISLIIDGLIERGCIMHHVVDGTGEEFPYKNKNYALDNLMSCDDSHLYVLIPDEDQTETWIYFVLGNDPEEVACDYGVSLEDYLDPIIQPWWE